MNQALDASVEKFVVNVGAGESAALPGFFSGWRQITVDVDPLTSPSIVASMTDLSAIASGSVQAVWASHCLEHLYQHEVPVSLREIRRILSDGGFVCLRVPDLQTVANAIVEDRLHEVLYQSSKGPVTAHDVVFGFGADIAEGRAAMAHRTGFTPTLLMESLKTAFDSIMVRRSPRLELVAVARKGPWRSDKEPGDLIDALGL